jgi:hypothetical protein
MRPEERKCPPVYEICVPEYHVRSKPDHEAIGAKIDPLIREHFMGQQVVIRCLGSEEHPGRTIDQLVDIIIKNGLDRYDPDRKGDRYENVENKQIDFFALTFPVEKDKTIMEFFIDPFYEWPLKLRGAPVRVNIAVIYDPEKLERVVHTYSDGRTKDDGFVFKDPGNKQDAIKAIIKIL